MLDVLKWFAIVSIMTWKERRNRVAEGTTQFNIAVAAGVSLATVSKLEAGTLTPALSTVEKLAKAYKMPVDELLLAMKPEPVSRRAVKN